jgi:hypothetical protein
MPTHHCPDCKLTFEREKADGYCPKSLNGCKSRAAFVYCTHCNTWLSPYLYKKHMQGGQSAATRDTRPAEPSLQDAITHGLSVQDQNTPSDDTRRHTHPRPSETERHAKQSTQKTESHTKKKIHLKKSEARREHDAQATASHGPADTESVGEHSGQTTESHTSKKIHLKKSEVRREHDARATASHGPADTESVGEHSGQTTESRTKKKIHLKKSKAHQEDDAQETASHGPADTESVEEHDSKQTEDNAKHGGSREKHKPAKEHRRYENRVAETAPFVFEEEITDAKQQVEKLLRADVPRETNRRQRDTARREHAVYHMTHEIFNIGVGGGKENGDMSKQLLAYIKSHLTHRERILGLCEIHVKVQQKLRTILKEWGWNLIGGTDMGNKGRSASLCVIYCDEIYEGRAAPESSLKRSCAVDLVVRSRREISFTYMVVHLSKKSNKKSVEEVNIVRKIVETHRQKHRTPVIFVEGDYNAYIGHRTKQPADESEDVNRALNMLGDLGGYAYGEDKATSQQGKAIDRMFFSVCDPRYAVRVADVEIASGSREYMELKAHQLDITHYPIRCAFVVEFEEND